jgi:hypothetical protein
MEKGDVDFLEQIELALEQAEVLLEQSHREKASEKFNKAKRLILNLQREIGELVK